MKRPAPRRHRRTLAAALLLAVPAALALPTDREQPIEISADRASLDERAGTAVYAGRVRLAQGTLRVAADRMTLWLEGDQVRRILAEGDDATQARYEQQPEAGAAIVRADADTIHYLVDRQLVRLEGDARLVQAGDRFEGESLRYDIADRVVLAGGADDGPAPGERIRMTLQPGRTDGAGADGERSGAGAAPDATAPP